MMRSLLTSNAGLYGACSVFGSRNVAGQLWPSLRTLSLEAGSSEGAASSTAVEQLSRGGLLSEIGPASTSQPKPDLVDKYLSEHMLGKGLQRSLQRKADLVEFQRHQGDTGSPQVMVAVWTMKIRELATHFDANKKHYGAMRQLELMVNRRRRMLIWLRKADFESYCFVIQKLGLKDIYTPTGESDRYAEGTRADGDIDDRVQRWRFNFHTKYNQKKTNMWNRLKPKIMAEDPAVQ